MLLPLSINLMYAVVSMLAEHKYPTVNKSPTITTAHPCFTVGTTHVDVLLLCVSEGAKDSKSGYIGLKCLFIDWLMMLLTDGSLVSSVAHISPFNKRFVSKPFCILCWLKMVSS